MQVDYSAPDDVRLLIETIGRTEDVKFSPGGKRLAVAAAGRDRIAIFDIEIEDAGGSPSVRLTGAVEIASPCLKYPHGLAFLDDAALIVGNRNGDVVEFALPPASHTVKPCALEPRRILAAGPESSIRWPGSLALVRPNGAASELLVCNNYRHTITRHACDPELGRGEVILSKWLEVPDGIGVSGDARWIAVSNHWTHGVLMYESDPSRSRDRDPDGILRSMHHPHGVRFSADGRYVFVADAGAPCVHIYASEDGDWRGVRNPMVSYRVMDEAAFQRGHVNVHEGGPKGVDLDTSATVLVVTSEFQPLAFFDLPAILRAGPAPDRALAMQFELGAMEMATTGRKQLYGARAEIDALKADSAKAREDAAKACEDAARTREDAAKAREDVARTRDRALAAEARAARQAKRAAKFKAKAEKAKAKARRGFGIRGRPWPIAPIRRLYAALKRPT